MSSIAIITARGGSKRIPRKNIKEFCGKPIIAYSIEAALQSKCFDEVMVSTDDYEIADVARRFGANVPFMRSESTSNDYAGTDDVLKEVLAEYKKRGQDFEYMCCIYPTAPFITSEKLKKSMEIMRQSGAEKLAPFIRYVAPPQWRAIIEENGIVRFLEPDAVSVRSQDLSPMYYEAGQFYFHRVEAFVRNNGAINPKLYAGIKISEMEAHDIDTPEDWTLAEIKYRIMTSKGRRLE